MVERDGSTSKSLDTRAKIVKGTLAVVTQNGIQETTTRMIATAAGVSLGTLHYQFRSKEAILLALFEHIEGDLLEALQPIVRSKDTLDERLGKVLRTAWQYAKDTRALQIVQYELTMYALRTPDGGWLADQQYEVYLNIYTEMLHTNIEPSFTRENACRLSRLMLAGLDGLILQYLTRAETGDDIRDVEALISSCQLYGKTLNSPREREEAGEDDALPSG